MFHRVLFREQPFHVKSYTLRVAEVVQVRGLDVAGLMGGCRKVSNCIGASLFFALG